MSVSNTLRGASDAVSPMGRAASLKSDTGPSGIPIPNEASKQSTDYLQQLTPDELSEYQARTLAKPLKYKEFFRKSQKLANAEFSHFFLAQELTPVDNEPRSIPLQPSSSKTAINKSVNSPTKPKANFILEFSSDGKYLVSAGEDCTVRVWEVISSAKDREEYAASIADVPLDSTRSRGLSFSSARSRSPDPSQLSKAQLNVPPATHRKRKYSTPPPAFAPVFKAQPICTFKHADTILSVSWSKNNFLLTSSEDGTVKLWHIDRPNSLYTVTLYSFASAVAFHPKDDRFFICCQWDGSISLHSILEKQAVYTTKIPNRITCVSFSPDCESIYIGCEAGYFHILALQGLRQVEEFRLRAKKKAPRVTGIESFVKDGDSKILVSTNESRVWLFSYGHHNLEVKYQGSENVYSTIKSTTDDDRRWVITGSENGWTYMWKIYDGEDTIPQTHYMTKFTSLFKEDASILNNKHYGAFHTHHSRCNAAIFAPRGTYKLLELGNDPIFELNDQYGYLVPDKGGPEERPANCIIVSTDDNGKIRVIRRDSAYFVRKYILSKKAKNSNLKAALRARDDTTTSVQYGNVMSQIMPAGQVDRGRIKRNSTTVSSVEKTDTSMNDASSLSLSLSTSGSDNAPVYRRVDSENFQKLDEQIRELILKEEPSESDAHFSGTSISPGREA